MSSEDAKNLSESLLRLHLASKITPATKPSIITLLHKTSSSSDYVATELRRRNLKSLPEFRGVASITLPKTAKHISRVQTSGPERWLRTRAAAIWEGLSQTRVFATFRAVGELAYILEQSLIVYRYFRSHLSNISR